MNNWDYPEGADNDDAPWNEEEEEEYSNETEYDEEMHNKILNIKIISK